MNESLHADHGNDEHIFSIRHEVILNETLKSKLHIKSSLNVGKSVKQEYSNSQKNENLAYKELFH